MENKTCTKCNETKPLTEFYKDSQKQSGYRPDCKDCNKQVSSEYAKRNRTKVNLNNMKYKTGVDKNLYNSLLLEQDNKCAICGCSQEENGKRFSIDHSHNSLLIRGLLCNKCNQGLGYFNDNIEILNKAIIYLQNNISLRNLRYGRN